MTVEQYKTIFHELSLFTLKIVEDDEELKTMYMEAYVMVFAS